MKEGRKIIVNENIEEKIIVFIKDTVKREMENLG